MQIFRMSPPRTTGRIVTQAQALTIVAMKEGRQKRYLRDLASSARTVSRWMSRYVGLILRRANR